MGNEHFVDSTHHKTSHSVSLIIQRSTEYHYTEDLEIEDYTIVEPQEKWRAQLVKSLRKHAFTVKDDDIYYGMMEVLTSIPDESFTRAIRTFQFINSSKKIAKKPFLKSIKPIALFSQFQNGKDSYASTSTIQCQNCQTNSQCHLDSSSSLIASSSSCSPEKGFLKNTLFTKRNLLQKLSKQISKEFHPIQQMKNSFLLFLKMKYRSKLDDRLSKLEYNIQKLTEQIHNDLEFYSSFLIDGCEIYKEFILRQSGIKETNYRTYMKQIIMESLFETEDFQNLLYPIIKQAGERELKKFKQKIPDHISIKKFQIKPELAIEGMFLNSLMLLSDFNKTFSPSKGLEFLQRLKTQICFDVDQYHRTFQTQNSYKIDSDNMLGILCFLICRMKPKMQDIFAHVNLLNSIVGDSISSTHGQGVYILTSMNASFQILQTEDFYCN